MCEPLLIQHGAPTLAGMKTGSLFSCRCLSKEGMQEEIRRFNRMLAPKGVRILPLRYSGKKVLLYLYRPNLLRRDFSNQSTCLLLKKYGYCAENPGRCVAQLACRLRTMKDFPHEIGLFLGYPPEDVQGFIENGADCCKFVGYWKVYGDEVKAKMIFSQYKKCTAIYHAQWKKGKSVERLTVAV